MQEGARAVRNTTRIQPFWLYENVCEVAFIQVNLFLVHKDNPRTKIATSERGTKERKGAMNFGGERWGDTNPPTHARYGGKLQIRQGKEDRLGSSCQLGQI